MDNDSPHRGSWDTFVKSRLNRERGEQDLFAIGELPWRRGFCVCHLQSLHGILSMMITKTRGELWGVSSLHGQSGYTNFEEQKDYTSRSGPTFGRIGYFCTR